MACALVWVSAALFITRACTPFANLRGHENSDDLCSFPSLRGSLYLELVLFVEPQRSFKYCPSMTNWKSAIKAWSRRMKLEPASKKKALKLNVQQGASNNEIHLEHLKPSGGDQKWPEIAIRRRRSEPVNGAVSHAPPRAGAWERAKIFNRRVRRTCVSGRRRTLGNRRSGPSESS